MMAARNSRVLWTIPLLMVVFFASFPVQAKYGGGTGEPNDPYLIYTAEQMNAIGVNRGDWDKHFKLMADIDLSNYTGASFNIIGTIYKISGTSYRSAFRGVFDGSGHTISNFNYSSTERNLIGLFGYVNDPNAEIKDLGLVNPNVDAGTGYRVGSLVGFLKEGTVTGCYAQGGGVSGNTYVGGLVGSNGLVEDSFVSVSYYPYTVFSGTINNSYFTGSVSGSGWSVGGIVGSNVSGTVRNCFATGSVIGNNTVGGLAGKNQGTISNSYSNSEISGGSYIGGLVGLNVGRYVGIDDLWWRAGRISNCYSTGSVSANDLVGGLVGSNSVAEAEVVGVVTDSFWDIQTSGQATSDGGIGKTTSEMQTMSTFTDAGWDFVGESINGTEDIWAICEGTNYPRLVWQIPAGDFVCPDGITIDDFVFFIEHWRDDNCDISNNYCQGTDLDFSGTVDEADLEILIENWLAGGND